MQVTVEETHSELGQRAAEPVYKVAAAVAIRNPFAGDLFQQDL